MPSYPLLPCSAILFRAIAYSNFFKQGKPTWQIFKRRVKDIDGLSLGITPEGAVADFTKPHFGLLSVHVGRVRDVKDELDVVQDGDEHAIITGLPYSYDENGNEDIYQKAAAQDLAKKLLEVARPYEP